MPLLHAIVLAIVQGLSEFLPISSSAHLVLIPWLFHWPEPGLPFEVALHAGTLLAVVVFFLREWIDLVLNGFGVHFPPGASAEQVSNNRRLFWLLVAGTIPGGIVGLAFEKLIEEKMQAPVLIACLMIVIGLLMWAADRIPNLVRGLGQTTLGDSLFIGAGQALALFPGVSRSGITIIAGLARKMTRETAARFSFLLSTPLIAGAAAKELPKLIQLHRAGGMDLPLSTLLISIAVSGIVGYAVIAFFLRYLQTRTLKIFVVYRIAFGIVILLLAFIQMGFAR